MWWAERCGRDYRLGSEETPFELLPGVLVLGFVSWEARWESLQQAPLEMAVKMMKGSDSAVFQSSRRQGEFFLFERAEELSVLVDRSGKMSPCLDFVAVPLEVALQRNEVAKMGQQVGILRPGRFVASVRFPQSLSHKTPLRG